MVMACLVAMAVVAIKALALTSTSAATVVLVVVVVWWWR
jgi:hypothetical protein